jgi:hypothetical protein
MNADWCGNLLKETIEKEGCQYTSDVHIKVLLDNLIKFQWITKFGQFSIFLLNYYDGHLNM